MARKKFEYIRRREIYDLFHHVWMNISKLTPLIWATVSAKLYWISCTKPMLNLMSRTRSRSVKDLKNLRIFCACCHWATTMQYLPFAAGYAQHMSAKRFWMVCNMVHTLCVNLVHREDNYG